MDNKDDKYLMSSVQNSLFILDLLSDAIEMGITEISNSTGQSKSSVFRMLYTLEKNEFVHKTSSNKYRLGVKFAYYGSIVSENLDLANLIRPYLRNLRDKYNETTHLGILNDDLTIVFMAKELSDTTIQMTSKIGRKLPFHVSAMGKILVANHMDGEVLEKLRNYDYVKHTNNTITEYDQIIKMLNITQEQQYALDEEESEEGLTCIAVPIKDYTGNTIAAISMSGPTSRMNSNRDSILEQLIATGSEASITMGYRG